jgi:hypothetical protein
VSTVDSVVEQYETGNERLNDRFQAITWALFLIMSGTLWFFSGAPLPNGLWFMGAGLLLLGLNVARIMYDIETNGFSLMLGLLALSIGLSRLMEVSILLFPMLLIGAGAVMLMRPLLEKVSQQQKSE